MRSSTLRLGLICVGIFGAVVGALFVCVYWSTASYVHSRSDRAIAAEHAALRQAYHQAGRDGLIAATGQRIADHHFEGGLYLLADASFAPIADNLKVWPTALAGPEGWATSMRQNGSRMPRTGHAARSVCDAAGGIPSAGRQEH